MRRLIRSFFPTFILACGVSAAPALVFIGTYRHGIYGLRFDTAAGSLSKPWLAAEARQPVFLALDPSRRHLYAAGELSPGIGGVLGFSVDAATGRLNPLNQEPTGGGRTVHVSVDASGRMVLAANYTTPYVCALPLSPSGRLGARSAFFPHTGPPGPNSERQNQPHPHCVTISPDNRFVLVCDLGLDRIFSYRVDAASDSLKPNPASAAASPPGAGPRHCTFSADGRFVYVANEMGSSVGVYSYDRDHGALSLRQTVSTLPPGFHGVNNVAEIGLHPQGRLLYVSNRGADSIAEFACDQSTGLVRRIGVVPCGGKDPWNLAFSPDGRWLLCANLTTNNITLYRIDPATGNLIATGAQATVDSPVCLLFY